MPTVLAVRHGETEWNRIGRMQGWAPVALNDRGRRQARAVAPELATRWDVDRVVASDLERTAETAALLAEAGPLPEPTHDAAFRERDVGRFQGLPKGPLRTGDGGRPDLPDLSAVEYAPDGGESLRAMATRVRDGFDRLARAADESETVLLVTHGGPIRALLGAAHDQSLATALSVHDPDNCSVTVFEADAGVPTAARRADLPTPSGAD